MHLGVAPILAAAWLGGIWPTFGDDPLESTFPIEAKGDIHFQADAVDFLEDGRPAVELDLAIPRGSLGSSAEEDSFRVQVTVAILTESGDSRTQFSRVLALAVPDSATTSDSSFPVPNQWLRLHPRWLPETAGYRITVEDLTRYKVGLVDRLRAKYRTGEAAARIPRFSGEKPEDSAISGILFAWAPAGESRHAAGGPGLRSVRSRLQPDPFRYYGLFQPVLTFYWERYVLPEDRYPPGTPLFADYRILEEPSGAPVLTKREPLVADAQARWDLKRFDISPLPSGSYRLEIALGDSTTGAAIARTEGRFQVLWEEQKWKMDEGQMLTYARVLLPWREYDQFERLGRGEKEAYLRDFWNRHDPTPPGQQNPLEEEFLRRVAYCNRTFRGYRPGVLTDRGRVFIRYGPPDEISENLNPQDEELLWSRLPQEISEAGDGTQSSLRESRSRTPFDDRAYIIWDYTIRGDPLIPEYVRPGMQTGLKFIFVDELGFGDYTLAYTNLAGGLQ